jgi:hypothetical protein
MKEKLIKSYMKTAGTFAELSHTRSNCEYEINSAATLIKLSHIQ